MLATTYWNPVVIGIWAIAGGVTALVAVMVCINVWALRRRRWWDSPEDWPEVQTRWRTFRTSLGTKGWRILLVTALFAALALLMTVPGGGGGGGGG